MIALDIFMGGTVQGVGFRPFVWKLANSLSISGWVCNTPQGAFIHAETNPEVMQSFLAKIVNELPAPARIVSLRTEPSAFQGAQQFLIRESELHGEYQSSILPDLCVCNTCKYELFDPGNRRYLHPFISCTHCGPRFSIIKGLPYDRPLTSMHPFPMCPQCLAEYENPEDRRFHAQPNCCPNCGPRIWCETRSLDHDASWNESKAPWLDSWVTHTHGGGISLVKGIGGFQLICDAFHASAVQALRNKKQRETKPFALMAPSIDAIKSICTVSATEELLLMSSERPIVILNVHKPPATMPWLAPNLTQLGVMLPNSPLHELFFSRFANPIVLTSANRSSEPMLTTNDEARVQGRKWCDFLVLHDREIINRVDDSVVASIQGTPQAISLRIGRGSSPREFYWESAYPSLAFGADLKNTVALAHHGRVTLSQHIGDMENPLTQNIATETIERLCSSYRTTPEVLACDAHPDYYSSQLAKQYSLEKHLPLIPVQHHHAHIAATWLEHQWKGDALGFAMDGTGYGDADCIWGSEVILYRGDHFRPLTHLQGLRLPGGDKAIREPVRLLLAALNDFVDAKRRDAWFSTHPEHEMIYRNGIDKMLATSLNCPYSRGMGRLFDLVGAMLMWDNPQWDGEIGTRLESLDSGDEVKPWPIDFMQGEALLAPIVAHALNDILQGATPQQISTRLHATVCELLVQMGLTAEQTLGLSPSELLPWSFAGGVFQNRKLVQRLQQHPLILHRICYFSSIPNDNGIALGQLVVASNLALKGITSCA